MQKTKQIKTTGFNPRSDCFLIPRISADEFTCTGYASIRFLFFLSEPLLAQPFLFSLFVYFFVFVFLSRYVSPAACSPLDPLPTTHSARALTEYCSHNFSSVCISRGTHTRGCKAREKSRSARRASLPCRAIYARTTGEGKGKKLFNIFCVNACDANLTYLTVFCLFQWE